MINLSRKPNYTKRQLSMIEAKKEIVEQIKPLLFSQGFIEVKTTHFKIKQYNDLEFLFYRINGIETRQLAITIFNPKSIHISIGVVVVDPPPQSTEDRPDIGPLGFALGGVFLWYRNYHKSLLFKVFHMLQGSYKFRFAFTRYCIARQKAKLLKTLTADLQPASLDKIFATYIKRFPIFVQSPDGVILRYYNRY